MVLKNHLAVAFLPISQLPFRRNYRSVMRCALAAVHSARNFSDQRYRRGSVENRNRSAWSLRNSDFSRIHGARGEDHSKEWSGAIMPALPPARFAGHGVLAFEKDDLVAVPEQLIGRGNADHAATHDHNVHGGLLDRWRGELRAGGWRGASSVGGRLPGQNGGVPIGATRSGMHCGRVSAITRRQCSITTPSSHDRISWRVQLTDRYARGPCPTGEFAGRVPRPLSSTATARWTVDRQPVQSKLRYGIGELIETDGLTDKAVCAEAIAFNYVGGLLRGRKVPPPGAAWSLSALIRRSTSRPSIFGSRRSSRTTFNASPLRSA